jgi:hypothetical protein
MPFAVVARPEKKQEIHFVISLRDGSHRFVTELQYDIQTELRMGPTSNFPSPTFCLHSDEKNMKYSFRLL